MNANEGEKLRLVDEVSAALASAGVAGSGARIVVAISGGQDSCALLHALASLREGLGIELHAAHLNHGFRAEVADEDARFVAELAGSLDVSVTVKRLDVPAMAKRLHLSSQEAARKARFEFLDRISDEIGADRIALGHTYDDHIETVLLNIMRGCGTDGLKGLPAASDKVIRPLIHATRADTEAYCKRNGIHFRIDATNESNKYLRNRVRSELLPELETYYNPAIRQSLGRIAKIAGDESAYLEQEAEGALAADLVPQGSDSLVLSRSGFTALHPVIARRVLRRAIRMIRGDLREVDFETIERLRSFADSAISHCVDLPGGRVSVDFGGDLIVVQDNCPASEALPFEMVLNVPGRTIAASLGISVDATYAVKDAVQSEVGMASMDYAAIELPIRIRNRRRGDRIQPLGMEGSKKVQDIMVDRKIPSRLRDRVPIITDNNGPIWVVGHVLGERVKVRAGTVRVLTLKVERVEGTKVT